MLKLLAVYATAFSMTAFSSVVSAHLIVIPHHHDGVMLQGSDYWGVGVAVLLIVNVMFIRYYKKIK